MYRDDHHKIHLTTKVRSQNHAYQILRLGGWLLTTWSGVRISPQELYLTRVHRDLGLFLSI